MSDDFEKQFGRMYERLMNDPDYGDDESEMFVTSEDIAKARKANKDILPDDIQSIVQSVQPDAPIEEEFEHFRRVRPQAIHKYTETEMDAIRESCKLTLVHDYSSKDEYHMSDQERAENDMLKEFSMKLASLKTAYTRVDEYIEAMRIVFDAWMMLKEHDYICSKEEFFQAIHEKRITCSRILMPKLRNMGKYNIDLIIKYISNPELDPKDLLQSSHKTDRKWYEEDYDEPEETPDELRERLLSKDDIDYILEHADNRPEVRVKPIPHSIIKGYDDNIFGKKKHSKKHKAFRKDVHSLLSKIQQNPENHQGFQRRSHIAESMFEQRENNDDFWNELYSNGSFSDKYDQFKYDLIKMMHMFDQYIPGEKYQTYADQHMSRFWRTLEANGFNVLQLRQHLSQYFDNNLREQQQSKKEQKKMERSILDRIQMLNNNKKFMKLAAKAEEAIDKYNKKGGTDDAE